MNAFYSCSKLEPKLAVIQFFVTKTSICILYGIRCENFFSNSLVVAMKAGKANRAKKKTWRFLVQKVFVFLNLVQKGRVHNIAVSFLMLIVDVAEILTQF